MQNGLLSNFGETTETPSLADAQPLPNSTIGLKTVMTNDEMQELLARSGKASPAFGAKAASMFDAMSPAVEAAALSNLTKLPSSLDVGAEIIVEPEGPAEAVPAAQKDYIYLTFNNTSPFLPPPVVYLGTGNAKARYTLWLNTRLKEVLNDLGEKTNRKGNISRRYGNAVRFIRNAISVLEMEAEYTTVEFKYVGLPLPRNIDFIETLRAVLHENKGMILALAPYFNPKPVPTAVDYPTLTEKAD